MSETKTDAWIDDYKDNPVTQKDLEKVKCMSINMYFLKHFPEQSTSFKKSKVSVDPSLLSPYIGGDIWS